MEIVQRAWEEWIEFKKVKARGQEETERRIRVKELKEWQSLEPGNI